MPRSQQRREPATPTNPQYLGARNPNAKSPNVKNGTRTQEQNARNEEENAQQATSIISRNEDPGTKRSASKTPFNTLRQ
jgi:hypothetical protein